MSTSLRIAFMGTPDFVVPTFEMLQAESNIDVVCVYTQPPRPKGRGKALQNTPVHDAALRHRIDIRTPETLKTPEDQKDFIDLDLDLAIVAAYGMMLPDEILNAPKHGCLNIHPSLLPRWRGVSPIQFALWKGDTETGVTVMQLIQKMDAGPVLVQEALPITRESTAQDLSDALWPIGNRLLKNVLQDLQKTGTLTPYAQDESAATYCHMLTKEHGRIDWTQKAEEIDRQIRALTPWPGTWTVLPDGKRLKILSSTPHPDAQDASSLPPYQGGRVREGGMIECHNGLLQLEKVQPEGKKPMDIHAALNGGYVKAGEILS